LPEDLEAKMSSNIPVEPSKTESDLDRAVLKRMLQVVIQFLVIGAILFITAGHLDWLWMWAYIALGIAILLVNAWVLPPELIAERGRAKGNVKRWDRVLTSISIFPTFGMFIVSGLDERFGWSPQLAPAVHIGALVGLALGQGLFTWAMVSNVYFSTAVRIQMERGHSVATGGPYRYIRHPGYSGYIVSTLATPLILGSLWGLIPASITGCLFVLRTALEDRTLQEELDGYQDYARQVRYRLVPGIW
jgi:protein-S-isoprenylcysteine O-methyltransferase Ste14